MKCLRFLSIAFLAVLLITVKLFPVKAEVSIQCPEDTDGDGVRDIDLDGVVCMHVGAGDGLATMADGRVLYVFSFSDVTDVPVGEVMDAGLLAANIPAPTIVADEGDHLYLNLTNVGMLLRPDLFDPHSIHWHGFPEASAIMDGVPGPSISINMGSTLTYYYLVPHHPGTYLWHCHVEATEHIQMGMIGNLYVRPLQNKLSDGIVLGTHIHSNPDAGPFDDPLVGDKYVYNDGDGSTIYDVEYPIQMTSFDPEFHDASEAVQPLPFALMVDTYPLLNGRGYPNTINPGLLPAPIHEFSLGVQSQQVSSLIEANQGDRILLRISNVSTTRFFTLATIGISMQVVGFDARQLHSESLGENLYFTTNSVELGGGSAVDVILDTNGEDGMPGTVDDVDPGTYFLYTTNLNYLSNNEEDFGGLMTEIIIN